MSDPAKVLLIGENGSGKTGAKAALVAQGYKLRSIDTDKGSRTLKSLLTDEHYPYAKYMRQHGVDWTKNVSIKSIDTDMALRSVTKRGPDGKTISEIILAPKTGNAWEKIIRQLEAWKDGDQNLGNVGDWDSDVILDFDTFTTMSMHAFYFSQALNGRLGSREEGHDYQRDIGTAQAQLRRLLEWLSNDSIKCNVIINSHITTIDSSSGYNQSPEQKLRANPDAVIDPRGFPSAIGRALSKRMGGFFNDVFIVQQSGSGASVRRTINTVPTSIDGANVAAKNSVWLERNYPVSYGLASIFAALRGEPEPVELVNAVMGASRPSIPNRTEPNRKEA